MKESIQSVLARLRDEFIAKLPERLAILQAALAALARGEADALELLHRTAHSLVGTAGTHRLMQISEAARRPEQLASALPANATVSEAELRALQSAFENLSVQAANPLCNLLPLPTKRTNTARIMVVEDDAEQAAWLRSILEEAGYQVDVFDQLASFRAALQTQEPPAAVIMDMVFPEGDDAGARIIAEMKTESLLVVPVIFISVRNDMAGKLAAHRAGATRYLPKPVDREVLLRVIGDSAALAPTQPYRVLMVDDESSQLAVNSAMLRHAGMDVRTAENPLNVIDVLDTFAAEVLLLDMHMPQCSGPELAAILRDDERYGDIPIVYLSAETDITRQLLALDRGGDHFLTKPVNPAHLVSVIGIHARRFRQSKEQAEALRAKHYELERQRQALDAHAIVSEADSAGKIISVNDKFCEVSGYTRSELLGQNHRIVKSGEHPPAFYEDMWHTISSGKIWQGKVCNRRKSGALYWVRTTIIPFLDENGLPYQYTSIRTDVTEMKQAEENSRHSQVLMRSVIDAIPDLIFFKDSDGKYMGCNTAFERYFNSPEALIIGHTDFDFVDEKTAAFFREQDARMIASGKPRINEEWITYPDGRKALLEVTKTPYLYGGKTPGVIGIGHDITQRKQQLQALKESEARWAFAIEGAGDGVWDWKMASGEMRLSRLYEVMLGYNEGELEQTIAAWVQSVHPEDLARVQANLQDYLAGKISTYEVELRLRCKDGGYKWVLCRGTVVERDAEENPRRMIGIHTDIDQRKQTELQLALFGEMVENTAQPIFLIDVAANYRLAYVNQAACKHWGASKEELLTWRIPDWDPTFDEEKTTAHFAETQGLPGVMMETKHRLKDGRIVPVDVFANARLIAGKPYVFGSFQNIAERKRNEESLKLFRRIFEASEQAIGVGDSEGRLVYINPSHERMHRVREEDVIGKHFSIFLTEAALASAPAIMEATNKGESWVGLLPQKRGDGSEFVSSSHISALMGSNGKPQYLFNILFDYTDELARQQELRGARDKADASNKAKSEFLASMSHELRTPMNAILGFAQLMEGDASCSADQHENLQQISIAGWHLLDLINEVLDLARVESGEVKLTIEEIDPEVIVAECLSLVYPLAVQQKITVENRVISGANRVRADYMRLKQVLINLLSNAIKYNSDEGSVIVEVVEAGDDLIVLTLRDTGKGMTPEQLDKLFEPFTRFGDTDTVQGTGIGLSICKKLIERMGGEIQVVSTPGEGSVFSVVLPKSVRHELGAGAEIGIHSDQLQKLSLLYIEDDAVQQSLVGRWASTNGWRVEYAHDAAAGIDAAMTCRFDAILLNIDLPGGFSGLDVKSVLNDMESLRWIPVIGISHTVLPQDIELAKQAGFVAYLPKPMDFSEFERTIQRTVHRGTEQ